MLAHLLILYAIGNSNIIIYKYSVNIIELLILYCSVITDNSKL